MLKSVGIPEYYLGGNVEFLGKAWKNQGLGLVLSAKTYIQSVIPKLEGGTSHKLDYLKTRSLPWQHPCLDESPKRFIPSTTHAKT
jgi:hypothetical protein